METTVLLYKEFCNIEQHLWQHVLEQLDGYEGDESFMDNLIDLKKSTIHELKCILSQRRSNLPEFPQTNFIILNRNKASETDPASVVNINVQLCQYCSHFPSTNEEDIDAAAAAADGGKDNPPTQQLPASPTATGRAKKRRHEGRKEACGCRLQHHKMTKGNKNL